MTPVKAKRLEDRCKELKICLDKYHIPKAEYESKICQINSDKALLVEEAIKQVRIAEKLRIEIDRLKKLLNRVKESFEPMPVIGNLKAINQLLRQSNMSAEKKAITAGLIHRQEKKNQKLYKDICKILKS